MSADEHDEPNAYEMNSFVDDDETVEHSQGKSDHCRSRYGFGKRDSTNGSPQHPGAKEPFLHLIIFLEES